MNILSYYESSLLGKDIKDWIQYHVSNATEYSKIAKTMIRYMDTLKDDRKYQIVLRPSSTASGKYKIDKPNIVRKESII